MNANDFDIEGSWRIDEEGAQTYEAVAKTRKSKRVIARATAHVSLDTGDALDRAYGALGRKAIEDSTNDTCMQLALKFPE